MKTICCEVQTPVCLTYDPKSKEFKQALKKYRRFIDGDGTEKDLIDWIAKHTARYGVFHEVNDIGWVYDPTEHEEPEQPWTGVTVKEPSANQKIERIIRTVY